jgi:branched-chain amino acid transport system ATP-binding protein
MSAIPLEVENLSAGYGPTRVLEGLSLSVPAGQRLAILGRNGMGKTTLLATLAGQTRRHGGRIGLGGKDITTVPSAARARLGLGYVPQARCIFSSLTVEENLFVGLKDRPKSALEEAYAMFPRLKERRRNLGNQLSGGEQQMLSIARTILGRPSVLLLDEPLEGLAPVICEELMAALTELAQTGEMTILLVEQRIQSALDFAERVIILERGRVAWSGLSRDLSKDHGAMERFLGVGGPHVPND